jgi:hypothetical protein
MRDDFLIESMKAAIRSLENMSDEEWFAEMQAAGVLDAEGNVLKRMPEPPKDEAADGRRTRGQRPAKRRKGPRRPPGHEG